jgi:hypothetical protein
MRTTFLRNALTGESSSLLLLLKQMKVSNFIISCLRTVAGREDKKCDNDGTVKTTFINHMKLLSVLLTCGFLLLSASPSPSQQLLQVPKLPKLGTFWLLSLQGEKTKSPPHPFDPYCGTLPIYEMKGFPGQYVVADNSEDYQHLRASRESSALAMNALESGNGEEAYSSMLFTNAPETLLFDTMGSSSNGVLPSWRDVRASPVPDGAALGIPTVF